MPKIKRLAHHEAQKIAAGQVVERPANIVKELVENAIDAEATKITVFIEDGGKQLIRIVDNGCGMDKEDAQLAFEKHATSKITTVDELITLTTFGFRGEALASIAAVSKVTLLTKQKEATEGVCVQAHEGTISIKSASSPTGTDISVKSLFYNVPARAKFLKKRETETRHLIHIIQAACFAYPHLHLQLIIDGKQFINCPPQETILNRCAQVWDASTVKHMISVEATRSDKGISLTGAISNHQWFRYDRSGIFFLVNNRWVTNHHLGSALLKGYNNVIPHGRYPMASIALMINPALIDINTHPRKEEITFAHPRIVEQLIQETVRTALEQHLSKQIKKEVSFYESSSTKNSLSFTPASVVEQPMSDFSISSLQTSKTMPFENALVHAAPSASFSSAGLATEPKTEPISILEKDEPYALIGQFAKTYILIEQKEGLYLVDQHAAHERILYEQFSKRFEDIPTINLMFPQLISCSQEDRTILEPHLSLFAQHGISIEPFSKDQLIIQSTPVHLKNTPLQELVKQVISWIKELDTIDTEQFQKTMHEKLRAQMACKAAVKAGDSLTTEQMQELIRDLHDAPNRFSCPHGRPTGWLMQLSEIEKRFRRRV